MASVTKPAIGVPARPWKAATIWMVACGALFLVVYNFCNWVTTQRTDVPTWNFAWEFKIPFVPWMIVPYWSLDAFFVLSFFLCSTREELQVLGKRITLAVFVAGACFLLFPLKLAFPRPEVTGFLGVWFDALRSFDQPHNLAPSLHIALRTIVWPVVVLRTQGVWNLLMRTWFLLIGASTLFTYQHQVLDVVTGWILALGCLHLVAPIDSAADLARGVRNSRVGMYYASGAAATIALAILLWPWGSLLLWIAAALGIVASGYYWFGGTVYRKHHGRLPFSTRYLLAPVLIGQQISLKYYQRQCHAWDEVAPGVLIGRQLSRREAQAALDSGVTAALDLTAEFSEAAPFLKMCYLNVPILDLTAPTMLQIDTAVEFIRKEASRGKVYVHCKIGYSRSASIVGAYLLAAGHVETADEAVSLLRSVRPSIVIRPEARRALADYQRLHVLQSPDKQLLA